MHYRQYNPGSTVKLSNILLHLHVNQSDEKDTDTPGFINAGNAVRQLRPPHIPP